MIVYQKQISADQERSNIESNFRIRDQLEGVELAPLPCFYMEAVKLLGLKPVIQLSPFLCQHKLLVPIYRDIYPNYYPGTSLLKEEEKALMTRAIRPERKLSTSESAAFRRLLIGTTMLPKPIVDYILEKVVLV